MVLRAVVVFGRARDRGFPDARVRSLDAWNEYAGVGHGAVPSAARGTT